MLRTTITRREIEQLAELVARRLRPEKVILFGSQAQGSQTEESDIDLLVVVSNPPSRRDGWRIAYELAPQMPLQLIFMSPNEYESTKDIVGGLAYPAHHQGIVLYEKEKP